MTAGRRTPPPAVRPAVPADVPVLLALVHELAAYEREPDAVLATEQDLRRALFENGSASCHVAEAGGEVVGLALWYPTYSTWTGQQGLWLEDLFVRPSARGTGLGRGLLQALAQVCVERGWTRFEWWVLDWNAPAIGFYRALGAVPQDAWTTFRVDGDALRALADGTTAPAAPTPASPTPPDGPSRGPLGPEEALAELSGVVLRDEALEQLLERVVAVTRQALPPAVAVSVTLVSPDSAHTAAYDGDLALQLDTAQYALGDGPCLEAGTVGEVVRVTDFATDTRWGAYAATALAHGVRSSLSVPLPLQQEVVGALNVYAAAPDAFDRGHEALARRLAAQAAVAIGNARSYTDAVALAEQMQQAMQSRAVIEQAKGVLMSQRSCGSEEAFGQLRELSQRSNRPLRQVAEALVASAERGAP